MFVAGYSALNSDPIADARASLVDGICRDCGHAAVIPHHARDPHHRRILGLAKRPVACTDCGCRHVFHAFRP